MQTHRKDRGLDLGTKQAKRVLEVLIEVGLEGRLEGRERGF